MLRIARDTVAALHYAVSADGAEVDRSDQGMPLVYLHGHGNIIPGLEKALLGLQQGDKRDIEIAAADGYGERDAELDFVVGTAAFPDEIHPQLKPGFRFRAEHPTRTGHDVIFTVVGRDGEDVAVTGNHDLAGKNLKFTVEIAWVRPATAEELSHGHIHDPCCHGHGHDCGDPAADEHKHNHEHQHEHHHGHHHH